MMTELQKNILERLDAHHRTNINDIKINIPFNQLKELCALVDESQLEEYQNLLDKCVDDMKNQITNVPALEHTECKRDLGIRFEVIETIVELIQKQIESTRTEYCTPTFDMILGDFIVPIAEHLTEIARNLNTKQDSLDYCFECKNAPIIVEAMKHGKQHKLS